MRAVDVRWIRLAVAAGAIVGSALVSSVAVATDETASTEPPPTTLADVASIDADPDGADVIVVDPPPDAPFEDIAVIEIVAPETGAVGLDAIEPAIVESMVDTAASVDESPVAPSSEVMPLVATEATDPAAVEPEEPGSEHEGGSGGQGNPYRMTFEVIWFDAGNQQITALDVVVPSEVLAQFELSATSQTGKGKITSATCTYPDGGTVLRCEFHNPGHGSGSDGLVIPARPTATYTVTVGPVEGWTISGADDEDYSARDLYPRGDEGGSGGHESGGGESGGHESGGESGGGESGGHESGGESGGGESGGHESGGESGSGESGGDEGGGVPCVHRVLMRQVAPVTPPPPPPPPPSAPEPPAASPAPDSGVVPPVVTSSPVTPTASAPVVESAAAAPSALPVTGGSISMILLIAGMLVIMGSALAGLTRRTS